MEHDIKVLQIAFSDDAAMKLLPLNFFHTWDICIGLMIQYILCDLSVVLEFVEG